MNRTIAWLQQSLNSTVDLKVSQKAEHYLYCITFTLHALEIILISDKPQTVALLRHHKSNHLGNHLDVTARDYSQD